jgi:hypothetical protein
MAGIDCVLLHPVKEQRSAKSAAGRYQLSDVVIATFTDCVKDSEQCK